MKKPEDKYTKRRLRTSYITSVISISLVLFLVGFFGLIVLHAKKISTHVKENIQLDVYFIKNSSEGDIIKLKDKIAKFEGIKSVKYISPEEGAKIHKEQYGEDFIEFLNGENPIPAVLEVRLNEHYANNDSLTKLSKTISSNTIVEEVKFLKDMVNEINENITKISFFFLIFSILLLLIAIVLINNTIRLSIYSHRFLIRTMDLIGATRSFIRKPFIYRGIVQGIIAAIIAIALLTFLLFRFQEYAKGIISMENINIYLILFGCIFLLGIIISWISTFFAVRKFMKMKIDNLYIQ